MTIEGERLGGDAAVWQRWGTVREDYSADGTARTYCPHDHARSRAHRWNEDGLPASPTTRDASLRAGAFVGPGDAATARMRTRSDR